MAGRVIAISFEKSGDYKKQGLNRGDNVFFFLLPSDRSRRQADECGNHRIDSSGYPRNNLCMQGIQPEDGGNGSTVE
ncbi:MAG: hypothetical protein R3F51_26205 [Cyanobacteriota/Melainabacteria group bacterium]